MSTKTTVWLQVKRLRNNKHDTLNEMQQFTANKAKDGFIINNTLKIQNLEKINDLVLHESFRISFNSWA